MSPESGPAPADRASATTALSSPRLEAAWAHPVLRRLLRGWRHLQRLDQRRPRLLDTAVVLAVIVATLPDLLSSGGGSAPFGVTDARDGFPGFVPYVLAAALILPLWWRRRAPGTVFFAIAAVSLVQGLMGVWLAAGGSVLVALYTLALHGSLRVLGWAVVVAIAQVVLAAGVLVPVERWVLAVFFLLGTVVAATALGLMLRIRRMYLSALEDRARRLEIERGQRVRLAAAAERSRVAREMHDIVGHNLSVMVSLADGAATLATNRGEQSAQALRILGDTGRQAMSELRRVLGVLHAGHGDTQMLSPQPAIRDLDALLARVRAAGLTVTYRTLGDLDALGSGVQLTVYRIVQEALTNTIKHAGAGSAAEVTVAVDAGRVRIRITDNGAPHTDAARQPRAGDPGNGLVGIRERAALYGGTVTIGPREGRPGWVVGVDLDARGIAPRRAPDDSAS
ncbi:histidine kinase [Streptomyces sp. NPDC005480]|uniref:sensor histidine kinase n=1 Tax=Streptomyces sp. NPDC005480 TaxID=3154880 RepID=UPI0033B7865A